MEVGWVMDAGVAALLGVVIGLGGSIFLDIFRERRENRRWVRDERKKVYISLLDALGKAAFSFEQEGTVSSEVIWEHQKYITHIKMLGGRESMRELLDKALGEITEAEPADPMPERIRRAVSIIVGAARKDLGVDL